jgi:A/G-specific adenine glycosylase
MIMVRNAGGHVLLERRPPAGVWGGLWGFPQCGADDDPQEWAREHLGVEIETPVRWRPLRHTFSHFHLDIEPVAARCRDPSTRVMEGSEQVWYNSRQPPDRGFAAPVRRLLNMLSSELEESP